MISRVVPLSVFTSAKATQSQACPAAPSPSLSLSPLSLAPSPSPKWNTSPPQRHLTTHSKKFSLIKRILLTSLLRYIYTSPFPLPLPSAPSPQFNHTKNKACIVYCSPHQRHWSQTTVTPAASRPVYCATSHAAFARPSHLAYKNNK